MSDMKLNPAIAKLAANGQVQCLICNQQVNPKVWLAHLNGRKHKEAVENKKKQLSAPPKRNAAPASGAPAAKKAKDQTGEATTSAQNGGLPTDFFDDGQDVSLEIQTPWQKDRIEEKEKHNRIQSANVIEGVPLGFFDDKKRDFMVREAVDQRIHIDKEFDKFLSEVNEDQTEEQQKLEEEAEREARQRDLANIDEQLAELKRLNELEIRKEQLLAQKRNRKRDEESDDDDLTDIDLNDWRSHQVL